MAAGNNDDILVKMILDIDDVQTKASQVERIFKSLSDNSTAAFAGVNTSLKTLSTSITETKAAFAAMATDIAAVTGANIKANAAGIETAKNAANAAREIKLQAKAQKDLADAALLAANTEITKNKEVVASYQAKEAAIKAAEVAAKQAQTTYDNSLAGQIENRARFQGNAFYDQRPEIDERAGQTAMYGGLFDEAEAQSFKEQAQYAKELRMEIERLGGVTKATRMGLIDQSDLQFLDVYGQKVKAMPSMWDRTVGSFGKHILQFGMFSAALGTATAAYDALHESISRAMEAQVQLTQRHAVMEVEKSAGVNFGDPSGAGAMQGAGLLAAKWGDNINDVLQDVTQWVKVTGDLNNALSMTDQALKFQTATGTDLEDTYRTLIALASQMKGVQMGNGDKDTFTLEKTPELLNDIYTAAAMAGAGMRQVSREGNEFSSGTANSAEILLHSFEQDGEALKKLGLNMADSVAINQALITAMGNTGREADGAAEKVSRLVGGIMELSKSSKVTSLSKDMGLDQFDKIKQALNSGNADGGFLERFAGAYEKLDKHAKNVLDTTIAGNRQYGIEGNLVDAIFGTYAKILKAEQDKNGLDEAAAQMMQTYEMATKQLAGEWSAVAATIGGPLIQALTGAVRQAAHFLQIVQGIKAEAHNSITDNADFRNELQAGFGIKTPGHEAQVWRPFQGMHTETTYNTAGSFNQALSLALNARAGKMDATSWRYAFNILNSNEDINQKAIDLYQTRDDAQGKSVGRALFGNKFDRNQVVNYAEGQYVIEYPMDETYTWNKSANGKMLIPPDGGTAGGPAVQSPTGKDTNKALKDYEMASQALADLKDQYSDVNASLKDFDTTLDGSVQSQDRQLKTFGYTQQGVDALNNSHRSLMASLHNTNETLENEIPAYEQAKANALAHANALGRNTEEGRGWMAVARSADAEIRSLSGEIANNSNAWLAQRDAIFESNKALADYQERELNRQYNTLHNDMQRAYGKGHASLDDLSNLENARHEREELILLNEEKKNGGKITEALRESLEQEADTHRANTDAIREEADTLRQSMQDKIEEAQNKTLDSYIKLADLSKERATALKDEITLTQDEYKFTVEYTKALGQASDQLKPLVQQWGQVEEAQLAANRAAVEYADQIANLQASPLFKGLQAGLTNLSGDMGTAVTDQLFGITADNNSIQAINNEIAALQQKKTFEDQVYSNATWHSAMQEAQHKTYIYNLDEEIKKLQDKAKAIKEGESEHGMLTKAAQAMTKSIVDDMMKQLSTNIEKSITNLFVKNPMQEEANKALKLYADATNVAQRQNMQTYMNASQLVSQPMTALTNALNGAGSNGTPVATAMEDLAQALTNGTGMGAPVIDPSNPFGAVTGSPFSLGDPSVIPYAGDLSNFTIRGMSGGGGGGFSLSNLFGAGSLMSGLLPIAGIAMGAGENASAHGNPAMNGILGSLAGAGIGVGIGAALFGGGSLASLLGVTIGTGGMALPLIPILALLGGLGGSMLGPHLNSHDNPDIFNTSNWGQSMANLAGNGVVSGLKGTWTANGQEFTEDPNLAKELGNQGELMFISNWIKANPTQAAKVLSPEELKDFSGLSNVTNNGGPIADGKNGNLTLSNGITMYWTDLSNAANDATQAIENMKNATSSATNALVSLNMYGGSQGYFPYNYEIPGYEFDPNGYQSGNAPSTNTAPGGGPTGGPTGGTPGAAPVVQPGHNRRILPPDGGGYVYRQPGAVSGQTVQVSGNIQVTTNVDGRTLARTTQAYTLRSSQAGYERVT